MSPKWIPQLADAAEVFRRIARRPGAVYSALVPNLTGLARAVDARVDKIAVFTAASESFAQRNINTTIAESLERFRPVIAQSPVPVRGYLSTAFHCPYEGKIAPEAVLPVCRALLEMGCAELSIGDTIGKATPDEVEALLDLLLTEIGAEKVALHFHDTYGQAIANAKRGAALGITTFDASAGGIGGCPYAPGASGNVATQALVELFADQTDVDRAAVDAAAAIVRPWLNPPPHGA